jgi:hypothetical protein
VVVEAAEAGAVRVGDLVVADDVAPVDRQPRPRAMSRAEASYCACVKPPRLVQPSCSIPIEWRLTQRLPACHATSEVLTSWTTSP